MSQSRKASSMRTLPRFFAGLFDPCTFLVSSHVEERMLERTKNWRAIWFECGWVDYTRNKPYNVASDSR